MGRTVDIDEDELRQLHELRKTVQTVVADPKAKLKLQEAIKSVIPTAVTPELDQVRLQTEVESSTQKELSALRKQIEDEKAERENKARLEAFATKHEEGFKKLREQGWTDAGIGEVRKIMEERGIVDHDIAAAYYEKQHPPQAPITPNGRGGWNFMDAIADDDQDIKKLIESRGENNGLIDKMARDALNDVRGNPRR